MFENRCKYSKAVPTHLSAFLFIFIRITERSLKFELSRSTVDYRYVWLWNSRATDYISSPCQCNIIIILDTYLQYSNSNLIADACSFSVHCAWFSLNPGMWSPSVTPNSLYRYCECIICICNRYNN